MQDKIKLGFEATVRAEPDISDQGRMRQVIEAVSRRHGKIDLGSQDRPPGRVYLHMDMGWTARILPRQDGLQPVLARLVGELAPS